MRGQTLTHRAQLTPQLVVWHR